ncbi:MAG TPA: endolytic transglycosylase MltG [Terriglobales bacterium]|nr:endolytic transglycosylase MltG [Terriglobales bacterium]
MKRLFKFVFVVVLIAGVWLGWTLLVPTRPAQPKFVMLMPGWSTRHIARELKANGVIRSETAFLLYHFGVKPKSLKAGEYKFENSASAMQVHERLVRGEIFVHTVTVPEGFNMFEIGRVIQAAGLGKESDFVDAAKKQVSLIRDLDPEATSLEGYLFPDTYGFTRTQSMQDMVAIMVRRFKQEAKAIGLSSDVHRVVTLASIVEKETAAPDERPMVASVYQNRLKLGMPLAADPSVIYAALLAGRYRGTIYQSDLQFDSPYNTYRRAGLPPGPIANPGRASLEAAMKPAESNYLFFVSDNNGRHRFARNFEEHSRNVVSYRRAVAAANR